MTKPQIIRTPGGESLVILALDDYEDMIDALSARRARAEHSAGGGETLTTDETRALVAAPTPLSFWRRKRDLTQAVLAEASGTSQGYIADMEAGRRIGDARVLKRIADALRIRIDDLVDDA